MHSYIMFYKAFLCSPHYDAIIQMGSLNMSRKTIVLQIHDILHDAWTCSWADIYEYQTEYFAKLEGS